MITHKGTITLETPRLILRRFKMDDAEAMFQGWANDAEVARFMTWAPHDDIAETRRIIGLWLEDYESDAGYIWAITLRESGEPIGSIGTDDHNNGDGRCELGYCMSKAHWGKGLMSEAAAAVLRYLFLEVGINRIQAKHDVNNPASGGVMRKNGMVLEGILREHYYREHLGFCDLALYSILRREYLAGLEADA